MLKHVLLQVAAFLLAVVLIYQVKKCRQEAHSYLHFRPVSTFWLKPVEADS